MGAINTTHIWRDEMSELQCLYKRTFEMNVSTTVGDIVMAIDGDDDMAVTLIKAIDLSFEDTDFTISLIKELFKSLRVDLDKQEAKDVISELKQINKSIK
jgi:hypothetical protein